MGYRLTAYAWRALLVFCFVPGWSIVAANGVGVIDGPNAEYLLLETSEVDTRIESQVAIIRTTQVFFNTRGSAVEVTFAFPLPEGASATGLRWRYGDGPWEEAILVANPQGSGGVGENPHPSLVQFLGATPLLFPLERELDSGGRLTVELTYVQLLPYLFGDVTFEYPNDYSLIQQEALDEQTLQLTLNSPRTIEGIQLLSHTPDVVTNTGEEATVEYHVENQLANADYRVIYTLSATELGLFSLSSTLPDSVLVDDLGAGFFIFVAEPDAGGTTEAIDKVFTLIVDRSGSMSGNKIIQARNAASFITNNLNEGDEFNIVDFSSTVASFRPEHVAYTPQNRDAALAYINTFQATGGTNISGAFDVAVPQFEAASETTANIIVFFTDGQATVGITNTSQLVDHVNALIDQTETDILLFTFGIGQAANRQLLTRLASENGGLSVFLDDDDLEEVITQFYLLIRNPVLLDTEIAFSSTVIREVYPDPLPNLYKGQQMIVSGRYTEAVPTTVTLRGAAFGQPVEYTYDLPLADTTDTRYQFLPKIWAKQKIEHLLVEYYTLDPDSPEAEALREEIIALSLAYGVVTPFTSFGIDEPPVGIEEGEELPDRTAPVLADVEVYPNPFHATATLRFQVLQPIRDVVAVRIYDLLGRLIRVLYVQVSGEGTYEVTWDGSLEGGGQAPSGAYVYTVKVGDTILAGRMTRIR